MELFGAYVPVTWWSLVVFVLAGFVGLGVWWRIRRRSRRRSRAVLAALLFLAVVLALTVTPAPVETSRVSRPYTSDTWGTLLDPGEGPGGIVLNALLFMPLTASIQLAGSRVGRTLCLAIALPATIEILQLGIPGRVCSATDLVANVVGGAVGAAIGYAGDCVLVRCRTNSIRCR